MHNFGWTLSRSEFFNQFHTSDSASTATSSASRDGLSSNDIISIKNEYCYLWGSQSNRIIKSICSDIWTTNKNPNPNDKTSKLTPLFQEFSISSLPFQPTCLDVRSCFRSNDLLLLWGLRGLAIITLPNVNSQDGESAASKSASNQSPLSTASTTVVAEKIYLEHSRLHVLQAKWYPSFTIDAIVVLNNDNFLRVYSLSDLSTPLSVVCVGRPSSSPFQYNNFSVGLVETPVDFDFGPELPTTNFFMIFILKNSGELSYVLLKFIEPGQRCYWQEQKVVYVHNEEIEDSFPGASSILASNTFPVIITIGCVSGQISHTVLLPNSDSNSSSTVADNKPTLNSEEYLLNGDVSLFIKEVVEIENPESGENGFGFIQLLQDPLCPYRYACIHGEGVHIINISFAPIIANLFPNEKNTNTRKSSLKTLLEKTSVGAEARFVLHCKLQHSSEKDQSRFNSNFAFSDCIPQKFILLGAFGTLVYDIPCVLNFNYSSTSAGGGEQSLLDGLILNSLDCLGTVETLKSILHKNSNQPYLQQQQQNQSIEGGAEEDSYERTLMESVRTLEREYVAKQQQAINHLASSIKTITLDTREIGDHLSSLSTSDVPKMQESTKSIAETHEALSTTYNELQTRLEQVLDSRRQPSSFILPDEEKNWLATLEAQETEAGAMKELLDELKSQLSNSLFLRNQEKVAEIFRKTKLSDSQIARIKVTITNHQQTLRRLRDVLGEISEKIHK